ncbi:MAG TPA: DUF1175 family protein [Pyrinomonadaceae bacterium]|nr:DUF1175 family protein [Pyrinomonadaceae bacterium]
MLVPRKLRSLSRRTVMTASVLVILLATFIWIFSKSSDTRPRGPQAGIPVEVGRTGNASASEIRPAGGPESTLDSNATTETADSDNDGIPDFAELRTFEDRESFRRWFTAIAEVQFYQLSEQWKREQRDCAGLVRFAMREALRKHDRAWFQRMGPAYEPVARDVRGFNLDANQLGEKIFRADFGAYRDDDQRTGKFSEFADARTLKNFNVEFVSRDRREAQPGDLLFYYQPWVQKFPYHVMVFLGSPRTAPNGQSDWVVYHTGSTATDDGTVKKVQLSVLDQHPDPRWRPIERNKNFLGFFRLKTLQ